MKGVYLGAFRASHPGHNVIYQDINGERDIAGDMLDVDLSAYDYVVATPPCNYWSRANYRRNQSEYSLKTRVLLPLILLKLIASGKPFIVENVKNKSLMGKWGLFNLPCYVHFVGRHTYWTNQKINFDDIAQDSENVQNKWKNARQGGKNVNRVIERFIYVVESLEDANR